VQLTISSSYCYIELVKLSQKEQFLKRPLHWPTNFKEFSEVRCAIHSPAHRVLMTARAFSNERQFTFIVKGRYSPNQPPSGVPCTCSRLSTKSGRQLHRALNVQRPLNARTAGVSLVFS
jgi:hypothetical protein